MAEGVSATVAGFTMEMVTAVSSAGMFDGDQLSHTVYSTQSEEPGIAQTLLDIANPDAVEDGYAVLPVSHAGVPTGDSLDDVASESGLKLQDETGQLIRLEDASEDQKQQVSDNIRAQIATLCGQLSDLGEECFLLSVRMSDDSCQHVGSVKGDHYCLLYPQLSKDFTNFCHGAESELYQGEDKEKASDSVFPEGTTLQDTSEPDTAALHDSSMEVDISLDVATSAKEQAKTPPASTAKPKVIILKRTADGKMKTDHQYVMGEDKTGSPNTKPASAATTQPVNKGGNQSVNTGGNQSGNKVANQSGKENEQSPAPNILFICNLCKSVFNHVKDLREHKREDHGETDAPCQSCDRVFTHEKALQKHTHDAHRDDTRIVCDSCVKDFNTAEELKAHISEHHNMELPMRCDVCEQTFQDLPRLMNHRKIHFDYTCFCPKCWQGFFDCLELEIHQQHNCQYKETLYKCYICGKKFSKLNLISKHVDTHPVHSPHVCRMCARGFESETELKHHRLAAHIIRPYKCELCMRTFKKKDGLIEHRRTHLTSAAALKVDDDKVADGSLVRQVPVSMAIVKSEDGSNCMEEMEEGSGVLEDFECSVCGTILSSQNLLDQHIQQHETATEEFPCHNCDKVFFSESLLSLHYRRDHKIILSNNLNPESSMSEVKVCEWAGCNKTFYDTHKLRQHMKYHEQRADKIARGISLTPHKQPTKCEICGKVLKYKSYLKAHMMSHTDKLPYQCEMCGQSYSTSKRLAEHLRSHSGEKPFKCKLCDKSFTSTALRTQHMVVHWGHKKFICDVCGKGFMSRKHFHDHLRIHAGEQQYKCNVCHKEFIYYRSLVRHSQVHVDPKERQKPYKCEFCQKEYTEVTGYKHHMRSVHTGENPYQCEFCGEGFHRNDKLKRHLKARHNMSDMKQGVIVTTQRRSGAPVMVRAEPAPREALLQNQDRLLQIVQGGVETTEGGELHVDVIQEENGHQQVFLIAGLGEQEGGETAFLQETQVIEGPDGVRYIIAGTGQELQVIESDNLQPAPEGGDVVEGSVVQEDEEDVLIMNDGALISTNQETLNTLANMASVAELATPQE